MWSKVAQFIIKFKLPMIIVIGLITVVMGYHASKVEMSYEFTRTVPLDDPEMVFFTKFKKQFGEDGNMMAIGVKDSALFRLENFQKFKALSNALRKIEGVGTVNTTVEDVNGNLVVLSCPEAPENLFQDYGQAQLVNGKAHINIDPTFAKNITVNEKHPLRVFVQLEGDCKGVYVENKTRNGFDVVELAGGNSNVKFSIHLKLLTSNDFIE